MERINLVDIDFNSFSSEEKRISFIVMDMMLKKNHENNEMITSFNPKDIYYDPNTKLFDFIKKEKISPYLSDTKEEAVLNNIIGLSTLAFCSYLKTYDPKDGLLNNSVISKDFDKFSNIFDSDDVSYYRSVLVDGYLTKSLPHPVYYSEHLQRIENEKHSKGEGNSHAYVKATEAGRLMTEKSDQAAFAGQFFFVASITSTLLFIVGYILYLVHLF